MCARPSSRLSQAPLSRNDRRRTRTSAVAQFPALREIEITLENPNTIDVLTNGRRLGIPEKKRCGAEDLSPLIGIALTR